MSIDNTVIAATTAAATFDFTIFGETRVSISASGLAAETITIQSDQGGAAWIDTGLTLTMASMWVQLEGPGTFRINKPGTTSASGVFIDGDFEETV